MKFKFGLICNIILYFPQKRISDKSLLLSVHLPPVRDDRRRRFPDLVFAEGEAGVVRGHPLQLRNPRLPHVRRHRHHPLQTLHQVSNFK